jgi:hypothetical protein
VQASRKQDRRLSAALLAAALAHTPEAEEVLRGARTRMSRKPSALARELLRNFPKGRRRRAGRRRRGKGGDENGGAPEVDGVDIDVDALDDSEDEGGDESQSEDRPKKRRSRRGRRSKPRSPNAPGDGEKAAPAPAGGEAAPADPGGDLPKPDSGGDDGRGPRAGGDGAKSDSGGEAPKPPVRRTRRRPAKPKPAQAPDGGADESEAA